MMTIKKRIILSLVLVTIMLSCQSNKSQDNNETTAQTETISNEDFEKQIVVQLESKSESGASGTVTFTQKDGVVYMVLKGKGFTPGQHAIHLHEKADCSSCDGKSSGGHWNPTSEDHGKWGTPPYHKGDIGNITADSEGNVLFTFQTDEWCLDCKDETKNIIGKAVIIHDGIDDFVTQPTGNAGKRICCGAILE